MSNVNTAPIANVDLAAIKAAIKDATIHDGKSEKAHAAFLERVAKLHTLGVMADDLNGKPAGKHFEMVKAIVAQARLTKAEYAIWSNDEVVKAGTAKHKLVNRVNSAIRNLRDNLRKLESIATSGQATKAGQGKERNINVRIYQEVNALWSAVNRDAESKEAPELAMPRQELVAAFQRILDLVPPAHQIAKK